MNEDEIREIVRDELTSERSEQFNVREIIRDELEHLIKTDRFTFQRDLQILAGRNILLDSGTGTKLGTASDQKLGLWGVTPVNQPESVGDPSISTVSGTGDDATINSNDAALRSAIVALIDRLQESGVIK